MILVRKDSKSCSSTGRSNHPSGVQLSLLRSAHHRCLVEVWLRKKKVLASEYQLNSDALRAVPKRIEQLEMDRGRREYFYGILAVEQLCMIRVAVYLFLCNILSVAFFVWLLVFEHGSDL